MMGLPHPDRLGCTREVQRGRSQPPAATQSLACGRSTDRMQKVTITHDSMLTRALRRVLRASERWCVPRPCSLHLKPQLSHRTRVAPVFTWSCSTHPSPALPPRPVASLHPAGPSLWGTTHKSGSSSGTRLNFDPGLQIRAAKSSAPFHTIPYHRMHTRHGGFITSCAGLCTLPSKEMAHNLP
jgi:hypothetical protein